MSIIPLVIVGLVLDRRCPTWFMVIGFVLCLAAITLVSFEPHPMHDGVFNSTNATNTTTAMVLPGGSRGKGGALLPTTPGPGAHNDDEIVDLHSDFNVAIALFAACLVMW